MPQRGRVWAEIDIDALVHNYRLIRETVGEAKVLAAVKAEAYGHGGREVARVLENLGVEYFGVASTEEAIDLRTNGQIRRPILVLSPVPYREIGAIFDYTLTPTVTEEGFAKALTQEANRRGKILGVHVEVDTGMGRTGVSPKEAPALISLVINKPGLRLEGVFTHFPAAETDKEFTEKQVSIFDQLIARLRSEGIEVPALHSANSAAIFKYPQARYDVVRPGLALYGIEPEGMDGFLDLAPVLTLRTRIVNLRRLPKGASISYGRTYVLEHETLVATVSVGYGDGYPRALSNKGQVLYGGKRYPIIGTVCMDLMMLDLSKASGAKIGDEVTLIGRDGKALLTADEVAGWACTIPYEITTRISPRVPRIYRTSKRILGARTLLGSTTGL
ncbi:MAG: alanine racemase [Candidatus Stahlbacteria bacterium]|nr:MAG: alanine racemase [Candidatus Stahlbacteria bacterium]